MWYGGPVVIGGFNVDDAKLAEQGLNTEILHDLLSTGKPKTVVAKELGVSVSSLNKTIKELQTGQGLLLKYRELQHLQLTSLQARVLEAMTPDKIDGASIVELAQVYRILKDKELVTTGKANNITGLVNYLVALEKEEIQKNAVVDITPYEDAEEAELAGTLIHDEEDDLPNL